MSRPQPATPTPNAPGPIVVKLGGAALDRADTASPLWPALADLHNQSPAGIVLVHGGGQSVDRRLALEGLTSERRHGIRISPDEHMPTIVATLAGEANAALLSRLLATGARPVGLCLGAGAAVRARTTDRYGPDIGRVGEVTSADPALYHTLTAQGFLPVVSSIAFDEHDHNWLNINADDAASALARFLNAPLLLLLTDVPGVLDADGNTIESLTQPQAEQLIAQGVIHTGMIPKVRGALDAANQAHAPAVIASWTKPESLPGLASGQPVGTKLLPADGQHINTTPQHAQTQDSTA